MTKRYDIKQVSYEVFNDHNIDDGYQGGIVIDGIGHETATGEELFFLVLSYDL